MPDVFISGIGVCLPATVSLEQAVADGLCPPEQAEQHDAIAIAVAGDTPAPELALTAARQALDRAGQPPTEIDLLLYADSWHQGPDGWQPQYYLQRHLVGGTPLSVEIRHGCNGMFTAIQLAAAYLRADPRRNTALLVAADNFGTPLVDRWMAGPGYVLGDAGSALVLDTRGGFAKLLAVDATAVPEAEELHRSGEPMFPPGATVGRQLDFGARSESFKKEMARTGDIATLAKVGGSFVTLIGSLLDEATVTSADIARVAPMYTERFLVERLVASLNLTMDRTTWQFARTVGHLGASDQVSALEWLVRTGEVSPGDNVLLLGFGPGLTVSGAVVRILDLPEWPAAASPR